MSADAISSERRKVDWAMIIVTGGAGFIGSNIVKGLNERGRDDILVVDNLTRMEKFKNIQGLKAMDYMDKLDFAKAVTDGKFNQEKIDVIFHEGACSDTMEYNGKYMMENNFEYTKNLFHFATDRKIQFMYASSASTYGSGKYGFTEQPECEEALNVYAFSKLFMDNYVRRCSRKYPQCWQAAHQFHYLYHQHWWQCLGRIYLYAQQFGF